MAEILKTMTVQEAAPLWDDPRSVHLKRWGETFGIRLDEFQYGHIATYEQERLAENVSYPMVWSEVKALRALLQHVGLGEEIESHYTTPLDRVKLTAEERDGLTSRVRAYIEYLEGEISQLSHEGDKMKGTLRKINWGRRRFEACQLRTLVGLYARCAASPAKVANAFFSAPILMRFDVSTSRFLR